MFGLNDGMRYYVCQRYVRMNLGINGLPISTPARRLV